MKGYRTYTTLAIALIATLTSMLYHFGVIGSELTAAQLDSIEAVLSAVIAIAMPVAGYFRAIAKKK